MSAVGDAVLTTRRKWPDRPHYEVPTVVVGEDEHGVWLGNPAGTPVARGGRQLFRTKEAGLYLIPRGVWWQVWFAPDWRDFDVYVDICTPPVWLDDSTASCVDLDLDVLRMRDGRVVVVDEDELAAHTVELEYPDFLVQGARAAAPAVAAMIERGEPPFDDGTIGRWHARRREVVGD